MYCISNIPMKLQYKKYFQDEDAEIKQVYFLKT